MGFSGGLVLFGEVCFSEIMKMFLSGVFSEGGYVV